MNKKIIYLILALVFSFNVQGQPLNKESKPFIGAQIFIEPGQTDKQIEEWFALMQKSGMEVCRIRMFGLYMKTKEGNWDFSLFDRAFRLAEKYNIKVYATLFPETDFSDVGGFKFPHTNAHQMEVAEYIRQVVTHFSKYSCLTAWVLINEPGTPNLPFDEPFTQNKYAKWKEEHSFSTYNPQGYPILNFEKEKFIVEYHNWYLSWLAEQVQRYDTHHDLHVNPHNIFKLSSYYDFPTWRKFLHSLGGSAHASWHFTYFPRERYTVAMSANAELIRAGAGELPWLMTELQGGNNIYSGAIPMCPTAEEITQWLWINLASEAKGEIFWSFNARATGAEAGEWAMINFNGEASDRLKAAADVAKFIHTHEKQMAKIRTAESGITILYNRTSMWTEAIQNQGKPGYAGRGEGVMCSAISYFEVLSEMGLQSKFCEFGEYDFTHENYKDQVIILSHQISLSPKEITNLEQFVQEGGTLLVDGLTGFYDDTAHCTMVSGFTLEKLFGARLLEFKMINKSFSLDIDGFSLPGYLWRGTLTLSNATGIGPFGNEMTGTVNHFGDGRVVWIPTPLGLGARQTGSYAELAKWITRQLPLDILNKTPHFTKHEAGMFMKSFQIEGKYYSLIINKTNIERTISIKGGNLKKAKVWFANKVVKAIGQQVTIAPEGTVVVCWDSI